MPNKNTPDQNRNQNQDQIDPVKNQPQRPAINEDGGKRAGDRDLDEEFTQNTPHESQPERASIDRNTEKLTQKNAVHQKPQEQQPRDTTRR